MGRVHKVFDDWEGKPRNAKGQYACGANRSGTDAVCMRSAMANGRCSMHGGKAARGAGNHNYKHGRYSAYLPRGLRQQYEAARHDEDLLSLADEIAVADVRIAVLMGELEDGGGKDRWEKVRTLVKKQRTSAGLSGPARDIADELCKLVDTQAADESAWEGIDSWFETRRRLSDTERKRLESMQTNMSLEQVLTLIGALHDTLARHVTDRSLLVAVTRDLLTLTEPIRQLDRSAILEHAQSPLDTEASPAEVSPAVPALPVPSSASLYTPRHSGI